MTVEECTWLVSEVRSRGPTTQRPQGVCVRITGGADTSVRDSTGVRLAVREEEGPSASGSRVARRKPIIGALGPTSPRV